MEGPHEILDVGSRDRASFDAFDHRNLITGLDLQSESTISERTSRTSRGCIADRPV